MSAQAGTVETMIPARIDRLPWTRWHWRIVLALGFVWVLDGLEVTIVGSIGARLQDPETLGLSKFESIAQGSFYVAGACLGALVFGYLTDRLGRKKLFLWTLTLYILATVGTAFTQDFWSFAIARFLVGMGLGGEYAAVNSAIDELIPARVRGQVDLTVNGSFWIGNAMAAVLSVFLLSDAIDKDLGWRLAFGAGGVMALGILWVRRTLPESPRWLLTHGRPEEAEEVVQGIERRVEAEAGSLPEPEGKPLVVNTRKSIGFGVVAQTMFQRYRGRTALGLTLMATQAFAYNAVLFSYATVLTSFFDVQDNAVGWYLLPFAIGNFMGPLLLGRFFDTLGRKVMIAGTYGIAGIVLGITAWLFDQGQLDATSVVVCWSIAFFFASAGASAGYLTVSEIFPMEMRAMAIAFFYAVATALGGILGPLVFASLVGSEGKIAAGYAIAAALMLVASVVEMKLGVEAAGKPLEEIAPPLTAEEDGEGEEAKPRDTAVAPAPVGPVRANRYARAHWSPATTASVRPAHDTALEQEVAQIVRALEEAGGPVTRRELATRTQARHWGTGRFSSALGTAVMRGQARRVGRRAFEAPRDRAGSV
jgi:MFS family permease